MGIEPGNREPSTVAFSSGTDRLEFDSAVAPESEDRPRGRRQGFPLSCAIGPGQHGTVGDSTLEGRGVLVLVHVVDR